MQVGGATGGGAGSCRVLSSSVAQSDQGKFSGIIRDAQNAFVPGVTVTVTNERTGESRTTVSNEKGVVFVGGLKPSTYTIRVEQVGFAPIEYTNMLIAVGQELRARLPAQAGGRSGSRHGGGNVTRSRHQLGESRGQRQRTRSAGPAGQRPPDVAADVAGTGLTELRATAPGRTSRSPDEPPTRTWSNTMASRVLRSSTPLPVT